ncbi:hypothetical protein PHYBOEH_006076 [Phytophthora boehmeriae]|uniref:Uncharacterized protein n=1 Tax=Phytophthora boehmeriae TaxID=109152 RepID=A0A8T1WH72_9STRA|nr:hypothetical protein PHYBOEH_006076 [Phytophthora boehmeriae]
MDSSINSYVASMPKTKGKKQHLKAEDLYAIVVWLEHPPNFASYFAVSNKTSIGKQTSKTIQFKAMAETLSNSSNGKFHLKPRQMRERFMTYKNRYLRAKAYEDSTGAGVTREGEENGIFTLNRKLEVMCPWYEKMKELFKGKANVTPLDTYDSTGGVDDDASSFEEAGDVNVKKKKISTRE